MGLPRTGDVASRFSTFVDGLVSVIGHAARAKPLRDYCTGLMMPCHRKSVEPIAAMTAPERTAAQHQSLLHFVGQGDWSDQQVLAKVREMVLPDIERHGPIELGSSIIRAFPRRDGIRSALLGNIAASWASKTIVRSPSPFRLQIIMRACRWLIVCICQRSGRRTVNAGAKPAYPRRSPSRPSRQLHLITCAGPVRWACRAAWY